jgi:chromosome partitioning protein
VKPDVSLATRNKWKGRHNMATVICVSNEKGGTGKSLTCASLSVGLARQGKKVLAIDADQQGSLTISFGHRQPEKLPVTLADIIGSILTEKKFDPTAGILRHEEGVDLMPANITLANTELALVPVMGREAVLRQYIDMVRPLYSHIVIDTSPSLGLMTVNALAASDSVIVPVAPKYLDVKGMELLFKTIAKVRKQINPQLVIGGILFTMVNKQANFTKEIIGMIEEAYGGSIRIFADHIPLSVRAAETGATGKSIFLHDPRGKVAVAYDALAKGVLGVA